MLRREGTEVRFLGFLSTFYATRRDNKLTGKYVRSDKLVFKAHSIIEVLTQEDFQNVVRSLRLKSNRQGTVFAMSASGQRLMLM